MRGSLFSLIALAACAATPDAARAPCSPQATVSPAGDHLTAAYELCAPVATFALEPVNRPQRGGDWMAEEGWTFDGETVRRADGAPFAEFSLRLAPDSRFYDRYYVAVDQVGAGWTLLLPALRPADGPVTVRFAGFPAGAVMFSGGEATPASRARLRVSDAANLVYVGPPENIAAGPVTLVAAEDVPGWLRERLLADMNRVSERMTARMGRAPPSAPILIVTYRAEGRPSRKAGVVGGNIVDIHLRNLILSEDDEHLAAVLTNLASHEAVHFWIGHVWPSARNAEEPWLHEGGAEYLASRIWQDPASLRAEAQERLFNCLMRANAGPLDGSEGAIAGEAAYDCGFMIMLAAEAASLRAGLGDIFDLWRAVGGAAGPGGFTTAGFLAEAGARGGQAFDEAASILLARADDARTDTLGQRLSALGLDIRRREAGPAEGLALYRRGLWPLLAQLCGSGRMFGFATAPDRLILDTEDTCGAALAGNPEVVSVNGAHLMRTPGAAYEAIRAACAQRGVVRFGTPDGRTLAPAACTADIPPLPPFYEITALPVLPAP